MKFYTKQHPFYCGIDLHADAMDVCVLDSVGEVVIHKNIPTRPKAFLRLIKTGEFCSQVKSPSRKPVGSDWISRLSKNEKNYSFALTNLFTLDGRGPDKG